jgi:hypothetical protein
VEMGLWHKFTRTPGGRLETAGVRPGDIPIETPGGLWACYGALLKSQSGGTGEFHVMTASEWHEWLRRRTIRLAPASSGPTTACSGRRSAPPLMLSVRWPH